MNDNNFIISERDIQLAITKLGKKLSNDYNGKPLLAVCVLKGAVLFFSDLVRKISTPVRLDFVAVSSYGANMESSGNIEFRAKMHISDEELKNYHILIIEDIVDTGNTLYWLKDYLLKKNPLSVKICTLIDKPSRRIADVQADYYCFTIPNKFIVGYGLDCNELYRELPYIANIEYAEKHYKSIS